MPIGRARVLMPGPSTFRRIFAGVILALISSTARAAPDIVGELQADLYAGRTQAAAEAAQARLAAAPGDDQARFALGVAQFLGAVEHLGQALHRYGLRASYGGTTGLSQLPLLRVPVPFNPHPEPATYEALRATLAGFVADLKTADDTLAAIGAGPVALPLNIGVIRLDLRGDGAPAEDEALWRIFARVSNLRWLDAGAAAQLLTDFDESDVPWLRAYCNLLMAITEFPLAYDWRETFDLTFQDLFPNGDFSRRELIVRDDEMRARMKAAIELRGQNQGSADSGSNTPNVDAQAEQQKVRDYFLHSAIAEVVAFIHLIHWPVVEPQRLASVLGHLEAMIGLSRENWRRIMADTSTGKRWIPNPRQTGVLPRMRVTEERVEAWLRFLDAFEAILQGRKLIPHWRFDKGINLRRFFLEPTTFDIVLMVQGSAAAPYLEDGEMATADTLVEAARAFEGDLTYFIWIN